MANYVDFDERSKRKSYSRNAYQCRTNGIHKGTSIIKHDIILSHRHDRYRKCITKYNVYKADLPYTEIRFRLLFSRTYVNRCVCVCVRKPGIKKKRLKTNIIVEQNIGCCFRALEHNQTIFQK